MKEQENMEREKRLEKLRSQVAITAPSDASRLFQLTAGWEERKKAGSDSGMGQPLQSIPRRLQSFSTAFIAYVPCT